MTDREKVMISWISSGKSIPTWTVKSKLKITGRVPGKNSYFGTMSKHFNLEEQKIFIKNAENNAKNLSSRFWFKGRELHKYRLILQNINYQLIPLILYLTTN